MYKKFQGLNFLPHRIPLRIVFMIFSKWAYFRNYPIKELSSIGIGNETFCYHPFAGIFAQEKDLAEFSVQDSTNVEACKSFGI